MSSLCDTFTAYDVCFCTELHSSAKTRTQETQILFTKFCLSAVSAG